MKSLLAEQARHDLEEQTRRMTPAERLKAFAEICRWVARLAESGRAHRNRPPR